MNSGSQFLALCILGLRDMLIIVERHEGESLRSWFKFGNCSAMYAGGQRHGHAARIVLPSD
jgi:hypothetical protein